MLRITAIGAGAVEYLISGSGCREHHGHDHGLKQESLGASLGPDYYTRAVDHGEALGRWSGSGLEALGISARAGDVVDVDDVRAIFGQLRRPESTEKEPAYLGRRPPSYKSEKQRYEALLAKESGPVTPERERELAGQAVTDGRRGIAYYDFTFSAPKSVSVYAAALRAAGATEQAAAVEAAHDRAVELAIEFADGRIAYTRTGWHGRAVTGNESVGKHEAGHGTAWTTWRHSTSRENEPQLHTHAALLNRTVTADGKIRALDGAAFRAVKEAIDTTYTRALEWLVTEATGARFELRPDGIAREIVGVDPELMAEASTRRSQVTARVAELMEAYRVRTGNEPGPAARKAMADMATLDTRKAKGPESGPAAVAEWSGQRLDRMVATVEEVAAAGHWPGGPATAATAATADRADMAAGQAATLGHQVAMTGQGAAHGPDSAGPGPVAGRPTVSAELVAAAIADVQARYAVWTVGNLTAALDSRLGDAHQLGVRVEERAELLEQLTTAALDEAGVVLVSAPDPVAVPADLRRTDGGSIYRRANGERYATAAHLATEELVTTQAGAELGIRLEGPAAEMLRVELAAAGLSADQVAAVAGIVASGRVGDLLVGPAGAGKSRTVGELAKVWAAHTGGRVVGVATSQIATQNLAGDGLEAINSTRFLNAFTPDERGLVRDQLRPGDMVIIDEAGMSSTRDLAAITALCSRAGAKVLYTGDPAQLDAVEAGGLFAHMVRTGPAWELTEVHRFTESWERSASLELRAGDQAAVDAYGDRGRLHTGSVEEMWEQASRAYLADTVAGKSSLLIVGSNHDAAALSTAVRERLIDLGRVEPAPLMQLGDGQEVGAGDRVQARMNDYTISVRPAIGADGRPGRADPVVNRAVYTVLGRDEVAGGLLVEDEHGARAVLPDRYVAEHVTLAYAVTVNAAQGVTVDTGHAVHGWDTSREQAYPASTRGREANHLYLVSERAPDVHEPERMEQSARERFAGILATSGLQQAAIHVREQGAASAESLTMAAAQWDGVTGDYSRARYTDTLTELLGQEWAELATSEDGFGRLLRTVREAELAGHNADAVLREAVTERGLEGASSMSDVLRWRLRQIVEHREPEQTVDPADWTTLCAPLDGEVGEYTQALAVLASDRQQLLGAQVAEHAPEWATAHLGPVPDLEVERVEWERRAGIAAAYRELHRIPEEQVSIGAAPSREYEFHRALWGQAREALGRPPEVVDHQALDDAQLYQRTERWARELAAAPQWVADQLVDAHRGAHEHRITHQLRAAELEALPQNDLRRAQLGAEVEQLGRAVAWHTERATELEEGYSRRADWAENTREAAADARLAGEELERRNLPAERAGAVEPPADRIGADPEHHHDQTQEAERETTEVSTAELETPDLVDAEASTPVERVQAERAAVTEELHAAAQASAERAAYTRGQQLEHTNELEQEQADNRETERARRDQGLEHGQQQAAELTQERSHGLDHGLGL